MLARVYASLLVVAVLVVAGACAGGAPATSAPAPPAGQPAAAAPSAPAQAGGVVKVAVVNPLTGPNAQYGQQSVEGIKLAVEELNAAGGALGKKLEFVLEDTASDKAQAVALVRRFAAQPEVVAILGITSTGELIPASEAAVDGKIPVISTGSAGIWPKEFNDWTFRTTVVSDRAIPAYLKELKEKLSLKALAVIYDADNDFSALETEFVKKEASKYGLDLVAVEAHRARDADFGPQLTRIMSRNPDAILIESRTNEAAGIVQQARQRGFKGHLLGSTPFTDATIARLAGDAVDGAFFYQSLNSERSKTKEFIEKWKRRTDGKLPSKDHVQAYDAVYLLADAMQRASTTTDRQKLRDAVGSTKGFVGASADFTYDGKGDNTTQRVYLYKWVKGGTYELVK